VIAKAQALFCKAVKIWGTHNGVASGRQAVGSKLIQGDQQNVWQ
jgi:hypothetical protein